ncbi:fasciclin domain-containing protein [Nocardioides litoris]|uniref:fasciclin domain-containing protein n=1 Tax=Nocardioides litoris TaxID=1926648 RepID=UPI00111E62C8|nr:fasciclin domain-containing protein [Nocardioides litoris]
MRYRAPARLAAVVATAAMAVSALAAAPSAQAAPGTQGNKPLAKVLAADGNRFDRNAQDFDIADRAIRAVLKAKPDSPLAAVADGKTRLTVFLPTDGAFRALVKDLTGKGPHREKVVFQRVAAAAGDVDTLETILLYHVVAGKTLTSPKVIAAAKQRADVDTAAGLPVGVRPRPTIRLADLDKDDRDPRVVAPLLDINRGNKQVAHGIDRVLRPIDL